ncbi:hypothetical protein TWF718_007826 [Orbilia javanica]|uniref:Uncharacterized protein n=1 Tax=Orbilia javanica TaxID=47235 RepID=A0AAN8MM83_9PEZI
MTNSLRLALLALAAVSKPLLVSAQCSGYNYVPGAPQCGIDFSDDTYLESNLIPLDTGCPSAFGHSYRAQATYTDYEGVVSTVGLVTPVTSPANPAETVRFLYNIRYADIKEGSPVTVNYYFPRITLSVPVPGFTIYNTVEYTDTTSTIFSTIESGTTTSTSTISATATSTLTLFETIVDVGVTETITVKPATVTRTITRSVAPTTKKVITTKKVTTTVPCIPNRKYPARDVSNLDFERRDTVFESKTYAAPTCGNTRPTTSTVFTNTVVTVSTATTKFTQTAYVTKVITTVTTEEIITIFVNATDKVWVTPPPVTTTKQVNAPRATVTTSVTIKVTVTKYATKTCCNKPPPPKYTTNKTCVIKPPKTTTKKVTKTTKKAPAPYKTTTKKVVKTTPKAPVYRPKTTTKPKPKTTKKCTKNVPKTTKRY